MVDFSKPISDRTVDSAKEYYNDMYKDIPERILQSHWYGELERLKYEFKKFLLHTVIEGKRNIFWIDGFDGSRKTSISTELTNPSTQFANNGVLQRISLDVPNAWENAMKITQRYEQESMPGLGRTVFLDRTWNNRAFVQHLYWYCTPEQYEEFLETLVPELERFLEQYDWLQITQFFFDITKEEQKQRLKERWEDPLRSHRLSESDKKAVGKHGKILKQRTILSPLYEQVWIPFMNVKTIDKKRAMIAILKYILQDKDYPKKSRKLDFTPDTKIIQPTKDEVAKVIASKI